VAAAAAEGKVVVAAPTSMLRWSNQSNKKPKMKEQKMRGQERHASSA
jgi:hypothetical protein